MKQDTENKAAVAVPLQRLVLRLREQEKKLQFQLKACKQRAIEERLRADTFEECLGGIQSILDAAKDELEKSENEVAERRP